VPGACPSAKGDEEKIHQAGYNAYIAKPMSTAGFLKTIEQFP